MPKQKKRLSRFSDSTLRNNFFFLFITAKGEKRERKKNSTQEQRSAVEGR